MGSGFHANNHQHVGGCECCCGLLYFRWSLMVNPREGGGMSNKGCTSKRELPVNQRIKKNIMWFACFFSLVFQIFRDVHDYHNPSPNVQA